MQPSGICTHAHSSERQEWQMVERRVHRRHGGEVCSRWSHDRKRDNFSLQKSDQSRNALFSFEETDHTGAGSRLHSLPCFAQISPHDSQKQARDGMDQTEQVLSSQYVGKGWQAQDPQEMLYWLRTNCQAGSVGTNQESLNKSLPKSQSQISQVTSQYIWDEMT